MYIVYSLIVYLVVIEAGLINNLTTSKSPENDRFTTANQTKKLHVSRRIILGQPVGDTRPYMVYLRAAPGADSKIADTNWLCGGVIIHERYILTSAACIEDAKNFYIISGTHQWYPFTEKNNACIKNSAKRAIWKCVPKAYVFDGNEFDNIRWMVGDIAVVKVEDEFNFERKISGCDFIPQKIAFNNRSKDLEKSKTQCSTAGWGTTEVFGDHVSTADEIRSLREGNRKNVGHPTVNSEDLLETDVVLISKKACKKRWDPRYHFIIDDDMICSRDHDDEQAMSAICAEREVNCQEMFYSNEADDDEDRRRLFIDPKELEVDTAAHIDRRRKGMRSPSGGFCENDHGGPLIVGHGKSAVVIGVMSACLTKQVTHKCYGPYLFTSVYKYRNLISCAIDKELGATCRRLLRASKPSVVETLFDWSSHHDGLSTTKKTIPTTLK